MKQKEEELCGSKFQKIIPLPSFPISKTIQKRKMGKKLHKLFRAKFKIPFLVVDFRREIEAGYFSPPPFFARKKTYPTYLFFYPRAVILSRKTNGRSILAKKRQNRSPHFSLPLLFFAEKVTHTASPHNMTPCEKIKKENIATPLFPSSPYEGASHAKSALLPLSPPSIPEG